jgi:hypothetical protein
MAHSDVIIPGSIKDPDRKTSRADSLTFAIDRAAARLNDDRIKTVGVGAQRELRALEDEIDAAAIRGLRGSDLADAARAARKVREHNLTTIVDRVAGLARDQQLPQLVAELAKIPSVDVHAEREVRAWLLTITNEREREERLRNETDPLLLAAAINAPFPLVSDGSRKFLTASYNQQHRRALVDQADAVDSFISAVDGVADMVRRQFDEIAPRSF